MRKVKIMIVGQLPREVFVRDGETMIGLIKRLSSPTWPLLQVGSWYQNSKPVDRILTILRDGDVLAGTPKVRGCGPFMVTVMLVGLPPRRVALRAHETLAALSTRLGCNSFPCQRVDKWFANGDRVIRPEKLTLRHGDLIAGAPRPHCD